MGVSASKFLAFPTVDVVKRLLAGEDHCAIAESLGMARHTLLGRLSTRGVLLSNVERFRPILDLVPEASRQLTEAMEIDRLPFVDAFEIALEYQPRRRAA